MKNKAYPQLTMYFTAILISFPLLFGALAEKALAKTYTLTLASAWEKNHPNNAGLLHFVETVNATCETKDGKLNLRWVGGPETFKARDLPDACKAGSVDFYYSAVNYYAGAVPQTDFTSLPGWNFDNASELWHAGIHKLVDAAWQKKGLKVLSFGSVLSHNFFLTKSFTNLSDFQGKKLRVPGGLYSFIPGYIGAVSTRLASAEVYGAMQRGTIDGGLQPMASYVKYGYWDVAPYVLDYPLASLGAWYWVNLNKFNNLPSSIQKKIIEIARDEETYVLSYWEKGHSKWMDTMMKKGTKFITITAAEKSEFTKKLKNLRDEMAKRVPPEESKELFKIYDNFFK